MTQLPGRTEFDDPAELTAALADSLRGAPLGGPRSRISAEVREWAASAEVSGGEDELLEAYNKAAQTVPTQLREELGALASDPAGREAVVGLLAIAGTSDPARQLTLEALEGRLERGDVREFARLNLRQRAQVIGAVIRVLAQVEAAEAVFALTKAFGARDDVGTAATEAGRKLGGRLTESTVLHELEAGLPASLPLGEMDPGELLFAALSLSPFEQSRLFDGPAAGELRSLIQPVAERLDADLREASAGSGTLSPYEVRLRDELFELILVGGPEVAAELRERASENLFRRDELSDVHRLGPYLPENVLIEYAERSLTQKNRRGRRKDRAVLAFQLVEDEDSSVRAQLRDVAVDCLKEKDPNLRAAAAGLLALDEQALGPEVRSQLVAVLDELPASHQRRLARRISGVEGSAMSHASFLRWVGAARHEELPSRLSALLARWAGDRRLPPDRAAEMLQVFAEGFAKLEEDETTGLIDDLVDVSSGWLKAQGSKIAKSSQALMGWQRFREIVSTRFGDFARKLRKAQAEGLLTDAVGVRSRQASPGLLAATASQELDDSAEGLVLDVLEQAVVVDLRAVDEAFQISEDAGQRRLLAVGLVASARLGREADEVKASIEHGTTQALEAKRRTLTAALDEALGAAEGNERLADLYTEIRETVGGTSTTMSSAESSEGGTGAAAPDGVVAWRRKETDKYPFAAIDADGGIELRPGWHGEMPAVLELIGDLDRRAHSKRAAPPAERPHYEDDLRSLLRKISMDANEEQLATVTEMIDRGRPELRELFWEVHDDDAGKQEGGDLAGAVLAAARSREASIVSRLEVAARRATQPTAADAVRDLDKDGLAATWETLRRLLEIEVRELDALKEKARMAETRAGAAIGERLAVPFDAIEELFFSYFQLRQQLADAGWKKIADADLGSTKLRRSLNPSNYEIDRVDDTSSDRVVIKTLGLRFGTTPIRKSRVEPVRSDADEETQEQEEEPASDE